MKIGDLVKYKSNEYKDVGIIIDSDTDFRAVRVWWLRQDLRRIELYIFLEVI